jgi:hypothetical protein
MVNVSAEQAGYRPPSLVGYPLDAILVLVPILVEAALAGALQGLGRQLA